jgi:hypothetical protein
VEDFQADLQILLLRYQEVLISIGGLLHTTSELTWHT